MHDTKIIKNFLSSDQIKLLKELVDKNPLSEIVEAPVGRYLGVSPEIIKFLNNSIDKLPNEILFIKILDATTPGGPHADTSLPIPLPVDYVIPNFARTFIIPIETTNTNTLVFNESIPIGEDTIGYISNTMPRLSNNSISKETYEKYLTHCSKNWCEKLSIDVVFPWIAGDILIFDRNKLHCSDNYITNELSNKKGFVIWSELLV